MVLLNFAELSNTRKELDKTKMLLKQAEQNTGNLTARVMAGQKDNINGQKDTTNNK